MVHDLKDLPVGTFFCLRDLPPGMTEQQLSEWFHARGLRITADAISIREFFYRSTNTVHPNAIFSVNKSVMFDMFKWYLQHDTFDGAPVTLELPRQNKKA